MSGRRRCASARGRAAWHGARRGASGRHRRRHRPSDRTGCRRGRRRCSSRPGRPGPSWQCSRPPRGSSGPSRSASTGRPWGMPSWALRRQSAGAGQERSRRFHETGRAGQRPGGRDEDALDSGLPHGVPGGGRRRRAARVAASGGHVGALEVLQECVQPVETAVCARPEIGVPAAVVGHLLGALLYLLNTLGSQSWWPLATA